MGKNPEGRVEESSIQSLGAYKLKLLESISKASEVYLKLPELCLQLRNLMILASETMIKASKTMIKALGS